ncbi:MAG: glycosyltransferase [Actinomycetia bacterium]|nr:glycosyltransferase [Actinomycetes bacterium]
MRILAVAELYPWPAVDGYRQRLEHMLGGLASAGTVDLFSLAPVDGAPSQPPPIDGLGEVVTSPTVHLPSGEWMRTWVRSDAPRRLLTFDWTEARRELAAWGPEPDVVWYSLLDTWVAVGDLFPHAASIVDFDNLENLHMRLRRRRPPRFAPGSAVAEKVRGSARWMASRSLDVVDERRWDAGQRRCAEEVDRVVVCSELDVERSGCDNAVAVPNGADRPSGVDTDRTQLRGDVPTMLFVGALDYEPNREAVEWMVREVLPLIRRRLPAAVLRIVGRGAERVDWVAPVAGVDLVGEVDEIRPELDRADVSVVPIRAGAGTRLKVVEALAHHIPLVTTTVGTEGIDVVDAQHGQIADDERTFADACLRLLTDGALRQQMADSGAELFEQRYTWDAIGQRVAELALEVGGEGDRPAS